MKRLVKTGMRPLAAFFFFCFAACFGALVWLTPHYPSAENSFLGECGGYASFFLYADGPPPSCPDPTASYHKVPPFDPATAKSAGTAALHPVSWAGGALQRQHSLDNPAALKGMRDQLEELLLHAHATPKGNMLFPYLFDWPYDYEMNPWYSSMAQGLAGAAFMAGWRVFGDRRYFEAAIKSVEAIRQEGREYQFYRLTKNGIWLKEYPHNPYSVLDGSLIAVLCIHDVWKALPDSHPLKDVYKELWQAALQGFKDEWPRFKAPFGLYFEDSKRRVTPFYYQLNMAVLRHLAAIDPEIETIRQQLVMPDGFFPRFFTTVSGAFFKITRTWWPHEPLGLAVTLETLPPFARASFQPGQTQ